MSDRIRFHLDEHIDNAVARALRAANIDVTTTIDVDLREADDNVHLSFGRAQSRMVVTDDVDFLILAAQEINHAGIVFCHRRERTLGQIIKTLIWVHSTFSPEEMINRVIHVPKNAPSL